MCVISGMKHLIVGGAPQAVPTPLQSAPGDGGHQLAF